MQLKNFFWLLPFASFLAGYLILSLIFDRHDVETPNLVGKQAQEALMVLSACNLNPRILTQKEEPDLPVGTIVSQSPGAGKIIKANQSVFLVISRKPGKIKVPVLVGKTVNDIEQMAEKEALQLKQYQLMSNYPAGRCFGQSPVAGGTLDEKKIMAYISAGNNVPVLMPDLKGKAVTSVLEFLESHGCAVQVSHNAPCDEAHVCSDCIIIDQRPMAGSLVLLTGTIPLHVQLRAASPEIL